MELYKKLVLYQIMIQFLMKSPHFWKSELWAPVQLFHTRPLAPVSVIGAPLQTAAKLAFA